MGFSGKEYGMTNLDTNKAIEDVKKYIKPMEDPIIEVINEDEILFLSRTDKTTFMGFLMDTTGGSVTRTPPILQGVSNVKKILATTRHLVMVANDIDVFIFQKHDNMLLQKITIPDDKKQLAVSNCMNEIFIASSNKVYFFELQSYEAQIGECVKKCKKNEAISIFDSYYSKYSKVEKRDFLLRVLYYKLR